MSASWSLTTFTVETSVGNGTEDALYANGQMQVPVIVTVKAVDGNNSPHEWTDGELSSLRLVDYDNPLSDLSDGWDYSSTENIFDHTIGTSSFTEVMAVEMETSPDKHRFWVTTTVAESKRIGASLKLPDGSIVDTSGNGDFDSRVTLSGKNPVDVLFEDLTLWQDTNTANGHIPPDYTYDQDNYYLTISDHREVRKLECDSFDGGSSDPYWYRSFGLFSRPDIPHLVKGLPCKIFYWWPVGPKSQVEVGCKDVHTTITINQQNNAGCFTRLLIADGANTWDKDLTWGSRFTVFDQYGNSCDFYPRFVDDNTLQISKGKPDKE